MAVDIGKLLMRFEGDDKSLNKAFASVKNGTKSVVKAAGVMSVAVAAGLTVVAKKAIDAAMEQEKAEARLESIATKVTKATNQEIESMKNLAAELQKVTTFGDEVLITGQSQLLSFGMEAEAAERLTGSLADLLAANKGVDATSQDAIDAANMLGKAYSGQSGALSRVGILMSDNQKDIIENGSAYQRSAVLVDILNDNYGGLAETLAQTSAGQLQQAKNAWGDILEVLGDKFLPILNDVLTWVKNHMPEIQNFFEKVFEKVGNVIDITIKMFKEKLLPMFNKVYDWVKSHMPKWRENTESAFNGVVASAKIVWAFFKDNILPILVKVFEWVKVNFPVLKAVIKLQIEAIVAVATVMWQFFKDNILPILESLYAWIQEKMPAIKKWAAETFDKITAVATRMWEFFKDYILPMFAKLLAWVQDHMPEIQAFFETAGAVIKVAVDIIIGVINGVIDALEWLFDTSAKIQDKVSSVFESMRTAITNALDGVIGKIKTAIEWFDKVLGKIKKFLSKSDEANDVKSSTYTAPSVSYAPYSYSQRAYGGAVLAGHSYLVNEGKPEVFTPDSNGTMTPFGGEVNIHLHGINDPNEVARQVVTILKEQGGF